MNRDQVTRWLGATTAAATVGIGGTWLYRALTQKQPRRTLNGHQSQVIIHGGSLKSHEETTATKTAYAEACCGSFSGTADSRFCSIDGVDSSKITGVEKDIPKISIPGLGDIWLIVALTKTRPHGWMILAAGQQVGVLPIHPEDRATVNGKKVNYIRKNCKDPAEHVFNEIYVNGQHCNCSEAIQIGSC
jgi:hypothetical protein